LLPLHKYNIGEPKTDFTADDASICALEAGDIVAR
jgi:hypothetical protein